MMTSSLSRLVSDAHAATQARLFREFRLYSDFHRNNVNSAIHCVFVPVIHVTLFILLGHYISYLFVLAATASLFALYACMELGAGLVTLPYLAVVAVAVSQVLGHYPDATVVQVSTGLHLLGWVAQLVGHALFEGRAPAITESLFGSIVAAPLFVNLEMLFGLGLASELKGRLAVKRGRFS